MNEKDCGWTKITRLVHEGVRVFCVEQEVGSYFGAPFTSKTYYTRTKSNFDASVETEISGKSA